MRRSNKNKKNIVLLLILILGITVGFALISTTLKINGLASLKGNRFDIHWDENSIVETAGSNEATTPATVIDQDKKNISFAVELRLPGQFYEFTVDAKNYGTVTGAISAINFKYYEDGSSTPTSLPSYLDYKIEYANGGTPAVGDVLKAGKSRKYRIRFEYKESETTLQTTTKTGTIEVEVPYEIHKDKCKNSLALGDIVMFDPVNYDTCSKTVGTCYKWMVVNDDSTGYDLLLLSDTGNEDFYWNSSDPAAIIDHGGTYKQQNVTSTWSNKIISPSTEYDMLIDGTLNVKFSETKGRVLLKSEYDSLPSAAKEELKLYSGPNSINDHSNKYHIGLFGEDGYAYVATETGLTKIFQITSLAQGATVCGAITQTDARPVIKVDFDKTNNCPKNVNCQSFYNDSWDTIITNVHKDVSYYPIGCTKDVNMGSYGTHTLRVANNTTPSECSNNNFSQTACGFVLEFRNITETGSSQTQFNPYDVGSTGGWENSYLRGYINNTIFNYLPNNIKNNVLDTKVISGHNFNETDNYVTTDKMYLFANKEIWGADPNNYDTATGFTRQLDFYESKGLDAVNYNEAARKYKPGTTESRWWWLRSAVYRENDNSSFNEVGQFGGTTGGSGSSSYEGISPAFRIG